MTFSLLLPLIFPLLLAALIAWPVMRPLVWRLLPLAALPALMLAVLAPLPMGIGSDWLLMGAAFGLDEISRLFLIFTALLWIAAGAAARGWFSGDARQPGFATWFLLAMAGNLGLILAQEALTFYAFFALMSFASYGLVIHARSASAYHAGRLYIAFVILGELALFAGLVLAVAQADSRLLADLRAAEISGLAAAFLIAGFAVKLGVMPLHFWLPLAHGAAPVPASAVLSGAMIKAGLYGMLAALPLGVQALPDHGTVLMAAGLVTVFTAVILGLGQDSPKTVLGFSSVSQIGLIALGLGAGLMAPAAWPALLPILLFLAAHHALAKGALFLGTGLFSAQVVPSRRALTLLLLAAPALVLAGLPLSSGALGKEALKTAFATGSDAWLPWLTVALTLSGLATTLLMARFAVTLWRAAPTAPAAASPEALTVPVLGLAAGALALPFVWGAVAGPIAAQILATEPSDPWPLALGIVFAVAALIRAHARAVGPQKFLQQLADPFVMLGDRVAAQAARKRRALRRLARQIPKTLSEQAHRHRIGQSAIAALILLIFAIEASSARQEAGPAVTQAIVPAERNSDMPIP